MKISNRRLKEITSRWNPLMVVYIRYKTKYSIGKMTLSIAFFLEFNRKITKLFKDAKIREIYIKDELTGIVLEYFQSFSELLNYAIGR